MEGIQVSRKDRKSFIRKERILKILKYIGNSAMILIYTILIFIIITSCITMYDAFTHPGKVPSVFGYRAMTVLTGSMRPEINPGDLVITNEIKDLSSVKVGDVVTYKNKENILITHRVEEIKQKDGANTYITKGDANPVADVEPVTENQLQGTYKIKIPYIGYVGMFIKSGPGLILFIITPMALILGMELKTYLKKSKAKSV